MRLQAAKMLINDTANAFMTQGLTINQGANDDEILTLQSSDIAHGMTSLTDTDTVATFRKHNALEGAMELIGYSENEIGLILKARVTTATATRTTSARAPIEVKAQLKSGTSVGTMGADKNLMIITDVGTTRFIFDSDGSGHADVEWTTFDKHDDIALLHDIEATLVPDTFGAAMKYDAAALTKVGILGKDSLHSEKPGTTRGMINFTKLSMLHHGAIRQVHQQLQDVKEFYQDKITALEARLLRLEA